MIPFESSLRALEAESRGDRGIPLLIGAVLLSVWASWASVAPLALYEHALQGRIEVAAAPHPVATDVDGRVLRATLAVQRRVKVGDVLVEIDPADARLDVAEAGAHLRDLADRGTALLAELSAERAALHALRSQAASAKRESAARAAEARGRAALARVEAERLVALSRKVAIADADVQRVRAEAEAQENASAAAVAAADRVEHAFAVERADRERRIAALLREQAALRGDSAVGSVALRRTEQDAERRRVRSPVDGIIGDALPLRPGAVLRAGDRIATVIPDGRLRVIAIMPTGSIGRIRQGQRATIRLRGNVRPSTRALDAYVERVATETTNGGVRVELVLVDRPSSGLAHGVTVDVDVVVEETTPWRLLLRSAGDRLSTTSSNAPAGG